MLDAECPQSWRRISVRMPTSDLRTLAPLLTMGATFGAILSLRPAPSIMHERLPPDGDAVTDAGRQMLSGVPRVASAGRPSLNRKKHPSDKQCDLPGVACDWHGVTAHAPSDRVDANEARRYRWKAPNRVLQRWRAPHEDVRATQTTSSALSATTSEEHKAPNDDTIKHVSRQP